MQPRINNIAQLLPEAFKLMVELGQVSQKGNVPEKTLNLVHLRSSQINGCAVCLDMHGKIAMKHGETGERLSTVAAWREAPWFTDAERAALALTEQVTRLADKGEAVTDEVWKEAARHYDESGLATLVLNIALSNFYNRMNASTRQIAGSLRW
ncbi:MAG TPA: carboxymuconolactone decarboxylase family protein [Polyangia bacterium]|nr:carboxymuconolactone decarboxylase family protein [Polyangia bacterium]